MSLIYQVELVELSQGLFLVPCYFIYFIYHLHLQLALFVKSVPHWLPIILINLSNDVHLNPGPQFQNNFFNFMSWNVNSLA